MKNTQHNTTRAILSTMIASTLSVGAATVTVPDVIVESIGNDVNGHYGVHTAGGFGSFSQVDGFTSASMGDDIKLTIRPISGMRFQVDTALLNRFVVFANFESLNPSFGGNDFRNGTGSVALNNVTGGTAPSIIPITNVNNRPFVTGPGNTPTGFFGQISANASHSNGQAFSFGSGLITFDSLTLTVPNVADLNWEDDPVDSFSFYFGNVGNAPVNFSVVPVPEPSSSMLLALAGGVFFTRRNRRQSI